MVHVRELDAVAYYDDSKATNVASVLASLDGFARPVVLIAGGRAKGDDLAPLRDLLARQGRALVAIGESSEQFFALADGVVPAARATSMAEAVAAAPAPSPAPATPSCSRPPAPATTGSRTMASAAMSSPPACTPSNNRADPRSIADDAEPRVRRPLPP
jgi:hypothetical protein